MPTLSKLVIKNGFNSKGDSQITGSLNASSGFVGALTGNASTATTLATSRTINGTSFNGSENVTVTAAANTLTGGTLAANISGSSLTSVGTLNSLAVAGNVTVTGTLTANTYIVSSSLTNMTVAFASGSTAFGNSSDDTHNFSGSLSILGSINAGTGGITGSFKGDGAALTGVTATAVFPVSQTNPVLSTTKLFSNDGGNTFVYVGQVTGSTYAGVSGDITIGAGGVAAIGSGKVTSDMIVNATITGTDIAAATVTNANLVKSGSVLGSTLVSLGATVTTVTGLSSVTSDVFAVNGDTGYLGVNSISKTFADSFTIVSNTASQVVLALDAASGDLPFNSIHIKYVMVSQGATNIRAGSIIIASNARSSGTDVVIAETSTQDIGDTSLIDFTATVSGTTVRLIADSTGFGSANDFRFEYTLM
jgi:hypothetical protein